MEIENDQSTEFLDDSLMRSNARYHDHNPYESLSSYNNKLISEDEEVSQFYKPSNDFEFNPNVISLYTEETIILKDPKEFTF